MTQTSHYNIGPLIRDAQEVAHLDELDFSDPPRPSFGEENAGPAVISEAAEELVSDLSVLGEAPSDDDFTPEQLIPEDGARSPREPGGGEPNDEILRTVDEHEIGGGDGLDEAELARAKPLDGKRWDGDADEPLKPAEPTSENFPADDNSLIDDQLADAEEQD